VIDRDIGIGSPECRRHKAAVEYLRPKNLVEDRFGVRLDKLDKPIRVLKHTVRGKHLVATEGSKAVAVSGAPFAHAKPARDDHRVTRLAVGCC
jgi:hypothetical protein